VNRLRWSAALVVLVLMLSWAGAAQAQTPPSEQPADGRICSADEGLTTGSDEIEISTEKTGGHPTASASFTVNEGCQVQIVLASIDQRTDDVFDTDPPLPDSGEVPTTGPGDHTLTVDLPICTRFLVFLDVIRPGQGVVTRQALAQDQRAVDGEDTIVGAAEGGTDCPSSSTVPSASAPSSTVGSVSVPSTSAPSTQLAPVSTVVANELPFTGSNTLALLIAALVLLTGGGAILFAARLGGRDADR
jgi:hypothetical protein